VTLDEILETITFSGYDGIEIQGTLSRLDWPIYLEKIKSYNLSVIGVTGDWTKKSIQNDHTPILLTNDHNKILYSIQYIKKCIMMCNYFGGYFLNICLLSDDLVPIDFNHAYISTQEKKKSLQKVIPILTELSKFSQEYGVNLLIEPLNRYTTPLCVQANDAIILSSRINNDNLLIMLDTFHMNIEEKDFYDTINFSRKYLRHIHLSDNNRLMPGYGHIDFDFIIKALKNINYDKNISFEIILPKKNISCSLKSGLNYIKTLSTKYDL
jgi:D-psicose/D-tagatose/L-ribulose 3-epimerase